jgi:alpha-L-fucosidase
MRISRRTALGLIGAAGTAQWRRANAYQGPGAEIAKGPFEATRESLKAYRIPEWFRDAKFGIWAHWGPQSAAEYGDWYARRMYFQGEKQYEYHVKTYGHPSKVGFKDVVATWKADKFDPDHLLGLYKKAGAKYFCSMGVHHDNFDLWNSKHQPRWNAVASGPKKDIVGLFKKASQTHGMKFAVSEHLSNSYNWFAAAHASDKTGPYAGIPYDGSDPQYADLYHALPKDYDVANLNPTGAGAMSRVAPDSWKLLYYSRIKDLVDQYQPDLLYTDGGIPFEQYGLNLLAHLYNASANRNKGEAQTIYTSKSRRDCVEGTCLQDFERTLASGISANPWQTDTCIGHWHYDKPTFEQGEYKSPKMIIDMLVDIVSRNGNLLLNFPLPNSGALDSAELKILDEITKWMAVNSEGIYSTRPWRIFGDGPIATAPPSAPGAPGGPRFGEQSRKDLTDQETRFTTKGSTLYAFIMGWPERETNLKPLGTGNAGMKIANVTMLGFKGKLRWTQEATGLRVQMPPVKPSDHAVTLKISQA